MSEREVIKTTGGYVFMKEPETRVLPGGVYSPTYDGQGNFMLAPEPNSRQRDVDPEESSDTVTVTEARARRFDLFTGKGQLASNASPTQPLRDLPHWKDIPETDEPEESEFSPDRAPETKDYDWVNQSYFPMEDYNPGLREADDNIDRFIRSEAMYREEGIDFRRSVLFFGPPGTGKTFFIRQKSRQLVEALCAVVVRIESAMDLEVFCEDGLRELAANLPTRLKVVVIEEISEFFDSANAHMQLSSLLDSGSLNDGVLIMCTTNHPTKIPENIIDRPSRLDLLAPVYHDDNPIEYVSAWYEHLMGEEFPEDLDEDWVRTAHEELSPAYLKELFIHAKILGTTIRDSFEKIQQRRRLIKGGFKRDGRSMGF